MKKLTLSVLCGLAVMSTNGLAQEKNAADLIAMFEKLSGKQPGLRKAHANGTCATATFEPNAELATLSASPIFAQESIDASVRFSMGSGNPSADQRAPGARGMAIQLNLDNGVKHNIVGNSTPVFAAKDPDTFFGLLETLLPDETGRPNMAKVGQYIATHPSTQALAHWQQTTNPPYSFGTSKYFGLHTFFFVDEDGKQTKFRWHLTPDAGERLITNEEKATIGSEFLEKHLLAQAQEGAVSFTLHATIGQEEDTNVDPSQAWPADREVMTFGKLTINDIGGEQCTPINFDPNVVSNGFKTSDDPVLRMRSPAYAISFGKRLSGQ